MKALTHYTFSAGASFFALSALGQLSWYSIAVVLWLCWSVNYTIDALGHSMVGRPSRTRLTHSIFTAPLWGALVSSASVYVSLQAIGSAQQIAVLGFWTVAGVMIAMGHLLLDSMTQAGIYYWRNRIALSHFKYDNPVLNAGFLLVGLGLLSLAFIQPNQISRVLQ